jgi:hypothetical protein
MYLGDGGQFLLRVFATEGFEGDVTISDEITAYRWVQLSDLYGLTVTPGLGEVLEAAFRLFDRT